MKRKCLLSLSAVMVFLAMQALAPASHGQTTAKPNSKMLYVEVNIDQPDVDDCYTVTLPEHLHPDWMKIYPNPGKGVFDLSLNPLNTHESIQVFVYDLTGKPVFSMQEKARYKRYHKRIDLGHLARGVYLIHVQTQYHSKVQRLVIQ